MTKNKKGRKKGEKTVRIKKENQESDIKVKTDLTYWERDPLRKRGEMPMAHEEMDVGEENEEISENSPEELDFIIIIEAVEDDDEKLENNEQEYLLKEDEEEVVEVVLVELEKEEPKEKQEAVILVELSEEDKPEQEEVAILVELDEDEFEEDFEEYKGSSGTRKRLRNKGKKEFNRRERILNGEMEYGLVNGKRRRENSSEKRRI